MNFTKKHLFAFAILLMAVGCVNNTTKKEISKEKQEHKKGTITTSTEVIGNYVSDGYDKRKEGYDWVSVIVTRIDNNKINLKVRSRADKKRPTCTFDAIAYKRNDSIYQTSVQGKSVLFRFNKDQINISTENDQDNSVLYFYCSGGASFAGSYKKIHESLDPSQIDKTQFSKSLNLQGVGFNVSSIEKNGTTKLTVFTYGLPHDYNESFDIGTENVVNAEVEDLNSDGSPELVVFTQKDEPQKRANVYAFSVNNKKSMSQVYFQPTEENKKINNGYNGHDEFALVETYLVQRFSLYKDGVKTDKTRQIQYVLVDGEASRKFKVKNQSEY
ncbi:MAG: hypothetical protein N4A37_10660 [Prolixibacteraceae bacterium]|jgi:hypothetical protein|nr:hypothetical protein [Prolixibacteraceae bacterium]